MFKSPLRFSVHIPAYNLAKKVLFPKATEQDRNVTTDNYEMTNFQIKTEHMVTYIVCHFKKVSSVKSLQDTLRISIRGQSIEYKIKECFLIELKEKFSVELPEVSWEFNNFSLDKDLPASRHTAASIHHRLKHLNANEEIGDWK